MLPASSAARATPDWSTIGDRGHGVQFYAHDSILIDLLGRYVGSALVSGDASVVVATETHRDGLAHHLKSRGLDVSIARDEDRYIVLDAADTLDEIMPGRWPHEDAFERVIGGAVDRAASGALGPRRRVAAFGGMVAMLWMTDQLDAALRLEELWNELKRTRAFSLCCAYPMGDFIDDRHTAPFLKICAQHTHVYSVERRVRPGRV